jgi:hypothetical protein
MAFFRANGPWRVLRLELCVLSFRFSLVVQFRKHFSRQIMQNTKC